MPKTYFEAVGEFHRVFGHPIASTRQTHLITENPKLVQFRIDLIDEEFQEMLQAVAENNITEVLDAAGDLTYVVNGMAQVFGIDMDLDIYNKIEDFECILPETLQKNLITQDPELVQHRMTLISISIEKLKYAVADNDVTIVADALADIMCYINGLSKVFGFDLYTVFRLVHESNMSKLCRNESEAMDTIKHYKTLPGFEDIPVSYRPSTASNASDDSYYVIYNSDTGKILKSMYFNLPDFSCLTN